MKVKEWAENYKSDYPDSTWAELSAAWDAKLKKENLELKEYFRTRQVH